MGSNGGRQERRDAVSHSGKITRRPEGARGSRSWIGAVKRGCGNSEHGARRVAVSQQAHIWNDLAVRNSTATVRVSDEW